MAYLDPINFFKMGNHPQRVHYENLNVQRQKISKFKRKSFLEQMDHESYSDEEAEGELPLSFIVVPDAKIYASNTEIAQALQEKFETTTEDDFYMLEDTSAPLTPEQEAYKEKNLQEGRDSPPEGSGGEGGRKSAGRIKRELKNVPAHRAFLE